MPRWYIGVDLGQTNDYTAISVLDAQGGLLNCVHLERFRHMLYPEQAAHVAALVRHPALRQGGHKLVVDATGVGPAVVDIFTLAGLEHTRVKITGGHNERVDEDTFTWYVPKRNLVSALQVALQTQQLKIAEGLELAQVLVQELLNFKVKINVGTAHDSYEAWREGDHDDLVLATSLAAWAASGNRREGDQLLGLAQSGGSYWTKEGGG